MSDANDTRRSQALTLAHACWMDLAATLSSYEAAVMRRDQAQVEAIRLRAHALVDSCLDHHASAAIAVRNILGD